MDGFFNTVCTTGTKIGVSVPTPDNYLLSRYLAKLPARSVRNRTIFNNHTPVNGSIT
jgi:hypothetical protein